jgi:hypothetical protein
VRGFALGIRLSPQFDCGKGGDFEDSEDSFDMDSDPESERPKLIHLQPTFLRENQYHQDLGVRRDPHPSTDLDTFDLFSSGVSRRQRRQHVLSPLYRNSTRRHGALLSSHASRSLPRRRQMAVPRSISFVELSVSWKRSSQAYTCGSAKISGPRNG